MGLCRDQSEDFTTSVRLFPLQLLLLFKLVAETNPREVEIYSPLGAPYQGKTSL